MDARARPDPASTCDRGCSASPRADCRTVERKPTADERRDALQASCVRSSSEASPGGCTRSSPPRTVATPRTPTSRSEGSKARVPRPPIEPDVRSALDRPSSPSPLGRRRRQFGQARQQGTTDQQHSRDTRRRGREGRQRHRSEDADSRGADQELSEVGAPPEHDARCQGFSLCVPRRTANLWNSSAGSLSEGMSCQLLDLAAGAELGARYPGPRAASAQRCRPPDDACAISAGRAGLVRRTSVRGVLRIIRSPDASSAEPDRVRRAGAVGPWSQRPTFSTTVRPSDAVHGRAFEEARRPPRSRRARRARTRPEERRGESGPHARAPRYQVCTRRRPTQAPRSALPIVDVARGESAARPTRTPCVTAGVRGPTLAGAEARWIARAIRRKATTPISQGDGS